MWNHRIQVPTLAAGACAALALAACTDGGNAGEDPAAAGAPPADIATVASVTDDVTVPGEPVQTYYSTPGAVVGIAGLDSASTPEIIRAQPNYQAPQVSQVWRTGAVELAGREWKDSTGPDATYWAEVLLDGVRGWMPSNHLFYFGETAEVTGSYIDIGPDADPYGVLAQIGWRATDGMGRWAVVTGPEDTGDGVYRVDVTGMPDDAQAGERLRVTLDNSDGQYRVAYVDRTLLCSRGVTDGMCL